MPHNISRSNERELLLPCILLGILLFLNFKYFSNRCVVLSCNCIMKNHFQHLLYAYFSCLYLLYICSNIFQILKCLVCFIMISFKTTLLCLGCKSFIKYAVCKYFLPISDLSFHSLSSVFYTIKPLFLMKFNFSGYSLIDCIYDVEFKFPLS